MFLAPRKNQVVPFVQRENVFLQGTEYSIKHQRVAELLIAHQVL
jgi:hypothetical protein